MTNPGASQRDCPLCHDLDDEETSVTEHIRRNCPVAKADRERMGLPPGGVAAREQRETDTESTANQQRVSGGA